MSGDLEYFPTEDPKPAYSKIIFEFNNGNSLSYISRRMFGRLFISEDIESFLIKKKLGPDAYKMSLDEFHKSLIRRTTNAKTALMNQSIVAGIGNIYSDEILFQSKINPKMKIDKIHQDKKLLVTLYDKIKSVLSYGIEKKGILNTYSDDFLIPHRKKEATCPICNSIIERYDIIGRRGFYCPKCQK
jgi:formamidopyrimidine-DNA glycosylase